MFLNESLLIDPTLASTDPLELPEFARHGLRAATLRLDKIHPVISGNKWFKLREHLRIATEKKRKHIITFGGAWSNHIVATAYAAREAGIPATGIIRGDTPPVESAALRDAAAYGMHLEFLTRKEYKKKDDPVFLNTLLAASPGVYIVPEGGAGPAGIRGSEDIFQLVEKNRYSHILCAIGTGTMFLGLALASEPGQKIVGIPVLKGFHHFMSGASQWIDDPERSARCEIIDDYHFGGYARKTEELLGFMRSFYRNTGIPTDFVYTGKLFYAALDMADNHFFPTGSEILIIHSGGLQGNRSLSPEILGF